MGQEVINSEAASAGLPDSEPPARTNRVEYSYTRELLLSFADLEISKKRPENLDPVVWRDAPSADIAEGGIAVPANSSRGLVRRDSREIEAFSKLPVEVPEWRKDSWRSGGSGALVSQGPRRKPYDEEPPGNAFSTSYPPRPVGNWGEHGHQRNNFDRPLQGQGSGRWEHRAGDREREPGRPSQKWDSEEIVAASTVPLEALRPDAPRPFGSTGTIVRPGWLPTERDGLLGSGGGLHRTYTGNFTTPSALRAGPERQMSMGPPERQMSMGLPERQMSLGLPERQMSVGSSDRQMRMPSQDRQMNIVSPDRQMSMGPLERQMSMGLPERQNSFGRGVSKNNEPYHPSRTLKQGPPFVRREETDFVNDETFGSENSTTDDRAEQERKRREAFELMRKDHQRLLQKQQKILSQKHEDRLANPESNAIRKHDESALWDSTLSSHVIPSSPPRSPEKRVLDSEPTSALVSTPLLASSTPRPAIPPGFAKVVQQKQSTLKGSSAQEDLWEGNHIESNNILTETGLQGESASFPQENGFGDVPIKVAEKLPPKPSDAIEKPKLTDSLARKIPAELVSSVTALETHNNVLQLKRSTSRAGEDEKGRILPTDGISRDKKEFSSDEGKEDNLDLGEEYNSSQESLLDKFFGKSRLERESSKGGLSIPTLAEESQIRIPKENTWSEVDSKMSKFAQWFPQEENQSKDGAGLSSDILSLFPSGGTPKASSSSPSEHALSGQEGPPKSNPVTVPRNQGRILPMPSGPSLEDIEKGLKEYASSSIEQAVTKVPTLTGRLSLKNLDVETRFDTMSGVFGEHSPVGKFNFRPLAPQRQTTSRSSPVFLTCEDIEQSMLAEAGTTVEKATPKFSHPSRPAGTSNGKGGQAADSAASRHLLSLLKKVPAGGKHSPENDWSSHADLGEALGKAVVNPYHDGDENDPVGSKKKSLSENATLEALFGKAFMTELRSVDVPLSANANAGDYLDNMDGSLALSGIYPVSRQSTDRSTNAPANTNVLQQWAGTLGPLTNLGWMEDNVLEIDTRGSLKDLPVLSSKGNQFGAPDKEDFRIVTSAGHGLWGNGMNSRLPEGSLPISTGVGNKSSFVSSAESTSFVVGDLTRNSLKGKGNLSRVHNSELDLRNSSKVNGDGKVSPSGNFVVGQLRASEDGCLPTSSGNVLSYDEPEKGPTTGLDSSGLLKIFKEDGKAKRSGEVLISREETNAGVDLGIDGFLSGSRNTDRKEILEDVLAGDKIRLGDTGNPGNDRKMADSLSDSLGFIGMAKDANARLSPVPIAVFPEQAKPALSRSSSNSIRFKNVVGAVQPTSQFNAFPSGTPIQHQHSIGTVYRSDAATSLSLQRQQPSIPVQHHLQQNLGSGMPMFPPQQFHPQPGIPQQQQLLGRTFSNGSSLEFPHLPFGHPPSTPQSRQLPAGPMHFPPAPHGHLSPPGVYPPMGHMGPTPNHFLPSAQMSQRGPTMSYMGDGHMFMPEQSIHDPHVGSKPGSQQGPPLFPLGGHALQSGQGPMYHQPLPQTLRGQQNQLLPGPAPWDLRTYSSELMRTSSKGQDLSPFVNGNGGGSNSLDRWFGMELSRNVSGIPSPGCLQVSPRVLDADSKVRFG